MNKAYCIPQTRDLKRRKGLKGKRENKKAKRPETPKINKKIVAGSGNEYANFPPLPPQV
jgi:hypothetical protein